MSIVLFRSIDFEEWRPVLGHQGAYEVSNFGRVRSLDRIVMKRSPWGNVRPYRFKGRMLSPALASGYRCVTLANRDRRQVSVLVAAHFIGPNPGGLLVLHGGGDDQNDRADNLRYGTQLENVQDAQSHGTFARGEDMPTSKLTEKTAAIAKALRGILSEARIASGLGVGRSTVHHAQVGTTWAHIPAAAREDALRAFMEIGR